MHKALPSCCEVFGLIFFITNMYSTSSDLHPFFSAVDSSDVSSTQPLRIVLRTQRVHAGVHTSQARCVIMLKSRRARADSTSLDWLHKCAVSVHMQVSTPLTEQCNCLTVSMHMQVSTPEAGCLLIANAGGLPAQASFDQAVIFLVIIPASFVCLYILSAFVVRIFP